MTTRNHTVRLLALLFSALAFSPSAAATESFAAESGVRSPTFALHTSQQQELLGPVKGPTGGDASVISDGSLQSAPSVVRSDAPPSPAEPRPFGECTTTAHCGQSEFKLPDSAR
jgi:hypothetical protein